MTDSPKLRPYAVAMLFGQAGNVNLGLGIVGATDREHAGAHAVLIHVRENNVTEPLIGITIMEIEDRVVRLMFNGLKPGEVVPMRAVEPVGDTPPGRPQSWHDHVWVSDDAVSFRKCLGCGAIETPPFVNARQDEDGA